MPTPCFALHDAKSAFHQEGSFLALLLHKGLYTGHDPSYLEMSEGSVPAFMTHRHILERWTHPWTRNSGQKRTPAEETAQGV